MDVAAADVAAAEIGARACNAANEATVRGAPRGATARPGVAAVVPTATQPAATSAISRTPVFTSGECQVAARGGANSNSGGIHARYRGELQFSGRATPLLVGVTPARAGGNAFSGRTGTLRVDGWLFPHAMVNRPPSKRREDRRSGQAADHLGDDLRAVGQAQRRVRLRREDEA